MTDTTQTPVLVLASDEEMIALCSDLEGRRQNLVDDGWGESADAEDIEAVIAWLGTAAPEGLGYPARLPLALGSAQTERLKISLENLRDVGGSLTDEEGDDIKFPFTAHIEGA